MYHKDRPDIFGDAVRKVQPINHSRGYFVVIEDWSETIQREWEFTPFFTAISDQSHHLPVIGHAGTDLLPTMRRNLNEIYLFLQTENAVKL